MNKRYNGCNFPDMFLLVHVHMDILFLEISKVEKKYINKDDIIHKSKALKW